MENEKRVKFIEIGTKRVNNVKEAIRILKNCSSDNYEYLEQDVEEMFDDILKDLNDTKDAFMVRFKEYKSFKFSSADEINLNLAEKEASNNIKTIIEDEASKEELESSDEQKTEESKELTTEENTELLGW